MRTRRKVAIGFLALTAAVLVWRLFLLPIDRSPSSRSQSILDEAESSGDVEVLFRAYKKRSFPLNKKPTIGRVDIYKIMQRVPIYSKMLANQAAIQTPSVASQINDANNRFISALEEVANKEYLFVIITNGRRLKPEDFVAKYQEFQDVTTKVLAKLNSN